MAIEIARVKAEMEAMESAKDISIIQDPIDDNLQTGDSRLLGGGISIDSSHRNASTMADPWQ